MIRILWINLISPCSCRPDFIILLAALRLSGLLLVLLVYDQIIIFQLHCHTFLFSVRYVYKPEMDSWMRSFLFYEYLFWKFDKIYVSDCIMIFSALTTFMMIKCLWFYNNLRWITIILQNLYQLRDIYIYIKSYYYRFLHNSPCIFMVL